jgi:hypothetical protein
MTSTSQSTTQAAAAHPHHGKHVHHGRTPAAWAGTTLALLAFILGGIALVIGPNWILFWISVAIAVLSMVLTQVLRSLGHGAD